MNQGGTFSKKILAYSEEGNSSDNMDSQGRGLAVWLVSGDCGGTERRASMLLFIRKIVPK